VIGEITAAGAVEFLDADGRPAAVAAGFEHFVTPIPRWPMPPGTSREQAMADRTARGARREA
jgi:hypothetical protein